MEALEDDLKNLQHLIMEEIKGIDPCYAYQAAMRVYNYYHSHCMVTSSYSINLKTGKETPIFHDRLAKSPETLQ